MEAQMNTIATVSPTMCPNSFSSAIFARASGAVATNSRLPRRASFASVPERARIDQRLTTSGKNVPYLYWM